MHDEILSARETLKKLNLRIRNRRQKSVRTEGRLRKVLLVNRGEIAKRFFQALHEEGILSVAIVTDPDVGQSWYEFADEVIFIGDAANYTHIPTVIAAALLADANGIYPGYGFLSEDIGFVEAIDRAAVDFETDLIFMGPRAATMRQVGNKLDARQLALANDVPLFAGSPSIPDLAAAVTAAEKIGYPVLLKLDKGGGGKGMKAVYTASEMAEAVDETRRIGTDLYKDDTYYIEKLIEQPVHIEVQIFNDLAVGIRKCAVQRRNQKIVEESGHSFLLPEVCKSLLEAAENMARISGYAEQGGAGTVEFLYDNQSQQFGFLEMNTRLQVEYAVTDQTLGIDLVKWQIRFFDGCLDEADIQDVRERRLSPKLRHAIECRIYAEDPDSGYAPSPGQIQKLELPTFNAVRCDFGFRAGDRVLSNYDPMIGKIIVAGKDRPEAIRRMERALQELYVKGILSNVAQLLNIVRHPAFHDHNYTNRLLQDYNDMVVADGAAGASRDLARPDRRSVSAVTFGALTEYISGMRGQSAPFRRIRALRSDTIEEIPESFSGEFEVRYADSRYTVRFLQLSANTVFAFVNGVYNGQIRLSDYSSALDSYLVFSGNRSLRLRVDRKPAYSVLRMKSREGKVQYHRMSIRRQGGAEADALRDTIRAPFQGNFVKIANGSSGQSLAIGDEVQEGDPLIVISAMKMETTIFASRTGKLEYLLEDGDLSRLQLGTTAEGRILGKSIAEGEVLALVSGEAIAGEDKPGAMAAVGLEAGRRIGLMGQLYSPDLENLCRALPQAHVRSVLRILKAMLLGFIDPAAIPDAVFRFLKELSEGELSWRSNTTLVREILACLDIYRQIQRLFSAQIVTDLSLYSEFRLYMEHHGCGDYRPTEAFESAVRPVLRHYVDCVGEGADGTADYSLAYYYIHRGYFAASAHREQLRQLVVMLARPDGVPTALLQGAIESLAELMGQELGELDEALVDTIRPTLAGLRARQQAASGIAGTMQSDGNVNLESLDSGYPLLLLGIEDVLRLHDDFAASFEKLAEPDWDRLPVTVAERSRAIAAEFDSQVKTLYSPLPGVFLMQRLGTESGLAPAIVACVQLPDCKGAPAVEVARQVWEALDAGLRSFFAALSVGRKGNPAFADGEHCVEILVNQSVEPAGFYRNDSASLNYWALLAELQDHFDVLIKTRFERTALRFPNGFALALSCDRETLRIDPLPEPGWSTGLEPASARLLQKGKWPVDWWMRSVFDQVGEAPADDATAPAEVTIPSIDEVLWTNPGTGIKEHQPVGAKIYTGAIGGAMAVFFMKDSRVKGGATGNLEGQKFFAAACLAYMHGWPLYVWNDGAGANIREGVVSLNRAAEGFMMNTLLAENVSSAEFHSRIKAHPDEGLAALLSEVESLLPDLSSGAATEDAAAGRSPLITVAVGIGSSAGLDVYGSSQASFQILLDSEESYRVLTGSSVIRAVTGEDMTNYEIGGARVMGKWTGVADFIARDKAHLIACIRRLHDFFYQQAATGVASGHIRRLVERGQASIPGERSVLTDRIVHENVDDGDFWQCKAEYLAANSVIAGFARLAGNQALILGTRNQLGIRSSAAVNRAREILRSANRTRLPVVLVLGSQWFQKSQHFDVRVRSDFLRAFQASGGPRIVIATSIAGLQNLDIASAADCTILIANDKMSAVDREYAGREAGFVVECFAAAFDLSARLIEHFVRPQMTPVAASGTPELPQALNQPYDMIADIIEPTFDAGSFLEMYAGANHPMSGPALVTGFARLDGKAVAVIADQPMIMGGAPDAPGTRKFRYFMELVNRRGLPLVMLSNAPGFVPGTRQERLRIQAIGAESLDENVRGSVPVVSVVLKQNYGGRQIHAFSKFLRPGISYIALEDAQIAVMGASAAFNLFEVKRYAELLAAGDTAAAEAHRQNYETAFMEKAAARSDASRTGLIDYSFASVTDLRAELLRGLELAYKRAAGLNEPER